MSGPGRPRIRPVPAQGTQQETHFPHPDHAETLLTISTLAASTGSSSSRAEDIIDLIHGIVPYAAASISQYDPLLDRHVPLVNRGYPANVADYLDNDFVRRDELYQLMRTGDTTPLRWADTPFNYRNSESAKQIFMPAGFDEGFSACLYSRDNRYTGVLHISVEDKTDVGDPVINSATWIQRLLAPVADGFDLVHRLGQILSPSAAGYLVSRHGRTHDLPGPRYRDQPPLSDAFLDVIQSRWEQLKNQGMSRWLWAGQPPRVQALRIFAVSHGLLVTVEDATPPHGLTIRELQVIRAVSLGHKNTRIANALKLSPRTVAKHLENILFKTATASRTELSTAAIQDGYLLLS